VRADPLGLATSLVVGSSGQEAACALRPDGAALCLGGRGAPEAAPASTPWPLASGGPRAAVVVSNRAWIVDPAGKVFTTWPTTGQVSMPLTLPGPALAITDDGESACALLDDGSVRCWDPQGLPSSTTKVALTAKATQIVGGGGFSCALTEQGKVACWGRGDAGQLGKATYAAPGAPFVLETDRFTKIAAGIAHVCGVRDALDPVRVVACWGSNEAGQLGGGVGLKAGEPIRIPLSAPTRDLSAGKWHTCALLDDGGVWCWGRNIYGQLGRGLDDTKAVVDVCTEK
jgi:hypothetical protein